jgi:serine-type D-Ala-D-Ala carboxypeptidase/endopeptidase (penicillin-binding protein 4)
MTNKNSCQLWCALALILAFTIATPSAFATRTGYHKVKHQKKVDAPKTVRKKKLDLIEGVLVERDDRDQTGKPEGTVLEERGSEYRFNPASTIKIATGLWALSAYGSPSYTYPTNVFTDGTIDPATHILHGDVYVKGENPVFRADNAEEIADGLHKQGIESVSGSLIVSKRFTMSFYSTGKQAGNLLLNVLSPLQKVQYGKKRKFRFEHVGIRFKNVKVGDPPKGAEPFLELKSAPLVDVLKVMSCYSINPVADNIGTTLGGPKKLAEFLKEKFDLDKDEVQLSSTSGLGENRISTHAMMKILLTYNDSLRANGLELSAILPVAGEDEGTLRDRFNTDETKTSVIAKTGTLNGVSALVGETNTKNGPVWFVIFEQHGAIPSFHMRQQDIVAKIQQEQGGPAKFDYQPHALIFEYWPHHSR